MLKPTVSCEKSGQLWTVKKCTVKKSQKSINANIFLCFHFKNKFLKVELYFYHYIHCLKVWTKSVQKSGFRTCWIKASFALIEFKITSLVYSTGRAEILLWGMVSWWWQRSWWRWQRRQWWQVWDVYRNVAVELWDGALPRRYHLRLAAWRVFLLMAWCFCLVVGAGGGDS